MKTKAKRKTPARKRQTEWFVDFELGGPDALEYYSSEEEWERVDGALYFASGREAGTGIRCGQMYVTYIKQAATLDQALARALADFHQAGLRLEILRVEIEPVAPPAPRRKRRRAS